MTIMKLHVLLLPNNLLNTLVKPINSICWPISFMQVDSENSLKYVFWSFFYTLLENYFENKKKA